MTLKPVNKGNNRFCGPAIISAITGIDTDEASRMIREVNGKSLVMGTHFWELRDVLNKLGYGCSSVPVPRDPYLTLAAWLRENKSIRTAGRIYLLDAGHHWQLVSGRRFVCGRTIEIVSVRDKRVPRRARVKRVWEIVKGFDNLRGRV